MAPTSPAERFAAARRRASARHLRDFAATYPFGLDDFQRRACEALEEGAGVLVAAPTGAGKTVVGEFAVHLALESGRKCFYTTPVKALSNQKFADLVARHGAGTIGLLTGDTVVNGDADVVVMTTEVLRNMLYAESPALEGLGYVVMDEVHYLADRSRGAVWEEVILTLPHEVRLVSLSATVSNTEEFGAWLQQVRGETVVVVEEHRPVPLFQHVLVGRRLVDLFAESDGRRVLDPDLVRLRREATRAASARGGGHGGPGRGGGRVRRGRRPGGRGSPAAGGTPARGRASVDLRPVPDPASRPETVELLDRADLLPAVLFVFSRAGCDGAVRQCLDAGVRLSDASDREVVHEVVARRTAGLSASDRRALRLPELVDGWERGVAAHHAGLLPAFKEVVEELFLRGAVKAVFATETLALGVNMPARAVVLERLVKWDGSGHADVTPGEYTQLTGRAGRRGIDLEGHAVVLWQPPGFDPEHVAGLASTRTYALRSSFSASYNTCVNVVDRRGRAAGRALLEESFAQFQADRRARGAVARVEDGAAALASYREAARCHLGDAAEYAALRRRLSVREAELSRAGGAARRAAVAQAAAVLRPGDVLPLSGRRGGLAAVVATDGTDRGVDALLVVTEDRWGGRVSVADLQDATPVGRVAVPRGASVRDARVRREVADRLRASGLGRRTSGPSGAGGAATDDALVADLRRRLRAHPVHGCDDREAHVRWLDRARVLEEETSGRRRAVERRTGSVARTFDRVCQVLDRLGYLDADRVTDDGRRLARVWSEADLLVAECLRAGTWRGLAPADLAAVVSSCVYTARRDTGDAVPRVPAGARAALEGTEDVAAGLRDVERDAGVALTPVPDPGFALAVHRWASGGDLADVLAATGDRFSAGDVVRWARQVLDLLGQVAAADTGEVSRTARAAADAVRRGVVAPPLPSTAPAQPAA